MNAQELLHEYRETGDAAVRERLLLNYLPLVKIVAGRIKQTLPQAVQLADLEGSERTDLANAVEDSAGELSKRIFDCAGGEYGASALAIGLGARVLFGQEADRHAGCFDFCGKL